MTYEPERFTDDPLDDELANVMSLASEIIAYVKRSEATELVLPMTDQNGFWMVTVRKMGISENGEST